MADYQYIKSLFLKFLEDKCTPEEVAIIIAHLKMSDDADSLPGVEEVRTKLGLLPTMNEQRGDEIFNRVIGRDSQSQSGNLLPARRRLSPWRKHWSVAATFLGIIFLSGIYLWYHDFTDTVQYATSFGETKKVLLPDGTKVDLNANSEFRYSEAWQEDTIREVWLEGEAFFSVVHTQDHRKFVVHTSHDFSVEVLGTQFNVKSREEKATVVLNSGKVKINTPKQDKAQWVMQPGELVEYEIESRQVNQKEVDTTLYTSWRNNLLLFKETSLAEIGLMISDNYGYEVIFKNDSLAQLHFTGSNPADQLDLLLKTLSRSFNLNISKAGRQIVVEENP